MNKWSNYGKWRHPKERNKYMNTLDKKYQDLLQDILDNGTSKSDRTGTGTISVFGRQIRHKMSEGFPLLTTKKMPFKTIVTELLWFLRGDTNIKYLVDNNCHIWDGDTYKNYENRFNSRPNWGEYSKQDYDTQKMWGKVTSIPGIDGGYPWTEKYSQEEFINKIKTDEEFAKKWGELGPIYGKQWRDSNGYLSTEIERTTYSDSEGSYSYPTSKRIYKKGIDQIQNLINELKTNPDSRRLMVNAWNVGELDSMVLPPCHYGFQVYTRELSDEERAKLMDELYGIKKPEDRILPWLRKDIDEAKIPTRAISLMFNMRSNDVPLGLPFNIASYALLLEIIGKMVNMIPDELIINLGDAHIYKNQVDGVKEQLTREPFELPKLVISNQINFNGSVNEFLNSCLITDFIVENYQSHPTIKIPLSN